MRPIEGEVGSIHIQRNSQLKSLAGLSGIRRVNLRVRIEKNPKLHNLEGLEGLKTIEDQGDLDTLLLKWNGLKSLKGLENLTMNNGILWIQTERNLESLDGLESLESLDRLKIINNKSLTSLSGTENLEKVKSRIDIDSNQALPSCLAENLSERVKVPGKTDVWLTGNGGYDFPVCDDDK